MEALSNFAFVTLVEPNNDTAKKKTQDILDYVALVCDFLSKKGGIKNKRLVSMSNGIAGHMGKTNLCYQDKDGNKKDYEMVTLNGLTGGVNNGKAIGLCVVNDISRSGQVHK